MGRQHVPGGDREPQPCCLEGKVPSPKAGPLDLHSLPGEREPPDRVEAGLGPHSGQSQWVRVGGHPGWGFSYGRLSWGI